MVHLHHVDSGPMALLVRSASVDHGAMNPDAELMAVRHKLETLVYQRLVAGFTVREAQGYDELAKREAELLARLEPYVAA